MQTSQIEQCTDCGSLINLYNQVQCSIYQLIKSKWIGVTYNTDAYFDDVQYSTLLRLKRILFKRLYNQKYPEDCITNQQIIAIGTRLLYKYNDCPKCPCEDFSDPTTTTTTILPIENCYTYTVVAQGSSAEPLVEYTDCSGEEHSVILEDDEILTICVLEDNITGDNINIIQGGLCS